MAFGSAIGTDAASPSHRLRILPGREHPDRRRDAGEPGEVFFAPSHPSPLADAVGLAGHEGTVEFLVGVQTMLSVWAPGQEPGRRNFVALCSPSIGFSPGA